MTDLSYHSIVHWDRHIQHISQAISRAVKRHLNRKTSRACPPARSHSVLDSAPLLQPSIHSCQPTHFAPLPRWKPLNFTLCGCASLAGSVKVIYSAPCIGCRHCHRDRVCRGDGGRFRVGGLRRPDDTTRTALVWGRGRDSPCCPGVGRVRGHMLILRTWAFQMAAGGGVYQEGGPNGGELAGDEVRETTRGTTSCGFRRTGVGGTGGQVCTYRVSSLNRSLEDAWLRGSVQRRPT